MSIWIDRANKSAHLVPEVSDLGHFRARLLVGHSPTQGTKIWGKYESFRELKCA